MLLSLLLLSALTQEDYLQLSSMSSPENCPFADNLDTYNNIYIAALYKLQIYSSILHIFEEISIEELQNMKF